MDDLEKIARTLGGELPPKDSKRGYIECPECHNKYHPNVVANEPFRTITDDDGKNKKKVCEDCYWKWIGSDDDKATSRYCGNIEETDDGICYIKNLSESNESER